MGTVWSNLLSFFMVVAIILNIIILSKRLSILVELHVLNNTTKLSVHIIRIDSWFIFANFLDWYTDSSGSTFVLYDALDGFDDFRGFIHNLDWLALYAEPVFSLTFSIIVECNLLPFRVGYFFPEERFRFLWWCSRGGMWFLPDDRLSDLVELHLRLIQHLV